MKSILLPTDFSKNSLNAIQFAMKLFENEECNFYILNVQKASSFVSDDLMTVSASATIYNTIVDAAKKSIQNIISKVKKKYDNDKHEFYSLVDYDNFIDAINQATNNYGIDLIVMGTKGAKGLERVIFGSNTIHVIKRCFVPILAIPTDCVYKKLSKIVFVTTNSKQLEYEELNPLEAIINLYDSELAVLHIADKNHLAYASYNNNELFDTRFHNVKHDYIDTTSKDMYSQIHEYLLLNKANMISILNKKHSFLERLFSKNNLESLAYNINIPFLVMHTL